ncbi:MAG TPA: hypothetical protein VJR58_34340 [Vineibacter sp.]|nr:hypothetical protein [Vineibacter sp.]
MHIDQVLGALQQRHENIVRDIACAPEHIQALENDYHRLLNLHPEHPALLFGLGTIYAQTDRSGAAIALLKQSIDHGSRGPEPWLNMAGAYKNEHKDASAAACYQRALEICERLQRRNDKARRNGKDVPVDPALLTANHCNALHGMASLYVNAGQPEKVIAWADKSLAIHPRDRFALWNKALGLLESGQFRDGFRLYDEAGFMDGGTKPPERKVKTYGGLPQWDGTPGKTVICYGEQGVGDEIMFASMLPDLMHDCRVIIDCDRRLGAMFKRSFADAVAVYPTSGWDEPFPWLASHQVDAWVAMGSLGRWYRPSLESFPRRPYLQADATKVEKWRNILGPRRALRVGISWAGGLKKTRFDQRSMELKAWADILRVPDVEWYSLQYHPQAPDECAQVGTRLGVPIHHWGDMIADYEETAGFLANLDLVITVNTSLVHLAGALDVPTWCLTPVMCAWRYQCRGPMPWYGSVEMFRQERAGNWSQVLDTVAARLGGMTTQGGVMADPVPQQGGLELVDVLGTLLPPEQRVGDPVANLSAWRWRNLENISRAALGIDQLPNPPPFMAQHDPARAAPYLAGMLSPVVAAQDAARGIGTMQAAQAVGDVWGALGGLGSAALGTLGMLPLAAGLANAGRRLGRSASALVRDVRMPVQNASKSFNIYDPPTKAPRPFEEDYRKGAKADATGRLTHDIEGRPLIADRVVGRNVVGGTEVAFPQAELDPLATSLTGTRPKSVAPREIRGNAGLYREWFDPVTGNRERAIFLNNQLIAEEVPRVLGHEVGHLISRLAADIPTDGIEHGWRGLRRVYNDLNTSPRDWRMQRSAKTGEAVPQRYWRGPEHLGYSASEVPGELMAEAVRAYMTDPNYLKSTAPEVAAQIREYANPNPRTNRYIQFNTLAAPAIPFGMLLSMPPDEERLP